MYFKDTRLYELFQWIVATAIGGFLLSGCLFLLENKVFSQHYSDLIQLENASTQLENKKEALLTNAYIGALEQLQEEEKAAILALPGLEKTRKIRALQISDYAKIDEIISVNRQLMGINEKEVAISSALQKKKDIAHYFLILFGLLLILFSMFVLHSAIRLLLAATGTIFLLVIGMFHVGSGLPYSLQATIVALLLASIAYVMWHFLSKKYGDIHRYLFLQMFGAFNLAYALFSFGPAVSEYFFPSEVEKIIKSYAMRDEMRAPLLKEQRELLTHELLNKEQKDHYIELDNKLNAIDEEWTDKILTLDAGQVMTRFFYQKYMPISALAVLYILLGIFVSVPVLISFGLILSGSFILLLGPFFLYFTHLKLSFVISLSYLLLTAAMLAFMGYHLYHQHKE